MLATFAYDDLGRRTSLTRGNGTVQSYGYDAVSRLATLTNDLAGTTNDLTPTFAYNPASADRDSTVRTDDLYAWTGHATDRPAPPTASTSSPASGGNALTYDTQGQHHRGRGRELHLLQSENLLLDRPERHRR